MIGSLVVTPDIANLKTNAGVSGSIQENKIDRDAYNGGAKQSQSSKTMTTSWRKVF